MTAAKARRPREHWEKTLERLLGHIMAEPSRVYTWKQKTSMAPYRMLTGEFEVLEVHVFGSFARGAADSGDLDVLVVIDTRGTHHVDGHVAKRCLFGQVRQVQVYADRIESKTYRASFPEHRLVWSREAPSLEQNLKAIPVVAGAGRFVRKTDRLPFPVEMLDNRVEGAEAVIDDIDAGAIVSTVIPLDTLTARPETWDGWWERNAHEALENRGRESVRLVVQYLSERSEPPFVNHHVGGNRRRSEFHLNGYYVSFRRPSVHSDLLRFVSVRAHLIVPDVHHSVTAAIWRLDRGARHPMVKAFKGLELWCIGQGESPAIITERDYFGETERWHSYTDRLSLHAYGSRAQATAALGPWKKKRAKATVVRLEGKELMGWLARVEEITVNGIWVDTDQRFDPFLEQTRAALEGSRPFTLRGDKGGEPEPTEYEGVYRLATGELLLRGVRKDRASGRLVVVTKRLKGDVGEEDASMLLSVEEVVGHLHRNG